VQSSRLLAWPTRNRVVQVECWFDGGRGASVVRAGPGGNRCHEHFRRRWSVAKRGIQSDAVAVSPPDLDGNLRLVIVLMMYEVSDEYAGDIGKAHWASKPILQKEVDL